MKLIILLMVIAGVLVTGGAYAANFQGGVEVKALGGSGYDLVKAASTTPPDVGWTLSGDQVNGVNITWTPETTGTYTVKVKAAGVNGKTKDISGTINVQRTDYVAISPAVDAEQVSQVKVIIHGQ